MRVLHYLYIGENRVALTEIDVREIHFTRYAIFKSILTTTIRFADLFLRSNRHPFLHLGEKSRKNCVENLLRRLQHSWQIVDPCGLTWYCIIKGILTRSLNSSADSLGFSSTSTICIKYSGTLGSIALYGDDPLDYPRLPATCPDPIGSPPTLA